MASEVTESGHKVYLRLSDTTETADERDMRHRSTCVYQGTRPGVLIIATHNDAYTNSVRPTRLTVDHAGRLIAALSEFVADELARGDDPPPPVPERPRASMGNPEPARSRYDLPRELTQEEVDAIYSPKPA